MTACLACWLLAPLGCCFLQLDGGLKRRLMSWRAEIVGCLAHAEAVIDFGEDEEDCNDEVYRKVESRWEPQAHVIC